MSKIATSLEQIRDLPDEELRAALARNRDELFRLQLGKYTNQVTSTALLTSKRRDIARLIDDPQGTRAVDQDPGPTHEVEGEEGR